MAKVKFNIIYFDVKVPNYVIDVASMKMSCNSKTTFGDIYLQFHAQDLFNNELLGYDIAMEEKKRILVYDALIYNRGRINWQIDFYDYPVLKSLRAYEKLNYQAITIHAHDCCGSSGLGIDDAITIISLLVNFGKKIWNFFRRKKTAYATLIEYAGYEKEFIVSVIKHCYTLEDCKQGWPSGFISDSFIPNKKKIEKIIMKDLGYKNKNNKWILKETEK